jgi:hypothetical protein
MDVGRKNQKSRGVSQSVHFKNLKIAQEVAGNKYSGWIDDGPPKIDCTYQRSPEMLWIIQ